MINSIAPVLLIYLRAIIWAITKVFRWFWFGWLHRLSLHRTWPAKYYVASLLMGHNTGVIIWWWNIWLFDLIKIWISRFFTWTQPDFKINSSVVYFNQQTGAANLVCLLAFCIFCIFCIFWLFFFFCCFVSQFVTDLLCITALEKQIWI